jgi:hypothetical protein
LLVPDYATVQPYLYHLTHRDNLNALRDMGCLLPAATLMERAGRHKLIRVPRRGPISLSVDGRTIVLRDQAPLHKGNMRLPRGYSFEDFVESLNRRIFFWPGGGDGPIDYGQRHFHHYAHERPILLRIHFQSLVDSNPSAEPRFCRYNSGSPRCSYGKRSPRGPETFVAADHFTERPKRVVEVTFASQIVLPSTSQFASATSGPWKSLR